MFCRIHTLFAAMAVVGLFVPMPADAARIARSSHHPKIVSPSVRDFDFSVSSPGVALGASAKIGSGSTGSSRVMASRSRGLVGRSGSPGANRSAASRISLAEDHLRVHLTFDTGDSLLGFDSFLPLHDYSDGPLNNFMVLERKDIRGP